MTTVMSTRVNQKKKALRYLMHTYRELREVWLSTDLRTKEKFEMFCHEHAGVMEHYLIYDFNNTDHVRPIQPSAMSGTYGDRLVLYLESLATLLNYRTLRAELWAAVDDVAGVLDRKVIEAHIDRHNALAVHGERLASAFNALCISTDVAFICTPINGNGVAGSYRFHENYVNALLAAAAKA